LVFGLSWKIHQLNQYITRQEIALDEPSAFRNHHPMKPLFIPLNTLHFDAFAAGIKTVEYRRYGRQWTERHCYVGREVILSKGYSGARMKARIMHFSIAVMDTETYGKSQTIACIHLSAPMAI
jgi:hypothetical protein